MGFIDKYPYTDFHELNLDWILKTIRELGIKMDEFEAVNKITFSGAWDITKQYPAWTVVSDNNIGYISIQPVPVGIVLTNTDYWRVIVDYSAQIAGMQTDITNLQNTVGDASSGLVKQTNDNTSAITVINQKLASGKWLFMGDSYENYGQWYSKVIARMGLTDQTDVFYAGGSGHGFTVSGSKWVTDFQLFCSGRSDLAEFKNIVIVGGLNDSTNLAVGSDGAQLRSDVNTFFTNAATLMPNAVITFAYVGAGLSDSAYIADRGNYNRQYACNVLRQLFTNKGKRFMENTKYCLYTAENFNADGVHPAPTGAEIIARAVSEWLLSGSCKIVGHTETGYDNQPFASGECQCYQGYANDVEDGRVRTTLRMVVAFPSTTISIGGTGTDLGLLPQSCYVRNSQPIFCRIQKSNSSTGTSIIGRAQVKDGHLFVYADQLNSGPSYASITIQAPNDRMDLGTLTFDEFVDYSL